MAHSITTSTCANILTHANFNRAPVIQTRKAGRLPNQVASLRRRAQENRIAALALAENKSEIVTLQGAIVSIVRAEHHMRYQLAVLQQKKASSNQAARSHG